MFKIEAILKPLVKITLIISLVFFASFSFVLAEEEYNKGYILKNESEIPESTGKTHNIDIPSFPMQFPVEFIPMVNLDAYGTYSNANSGSDVWGAVISGSISPAVKYNDSLYFIPLYNGSYQKQRFFAQSEEGARAYTEVQHHDLSLTAKYLATDKVIINPSIFGGWDLNVETNDEDWGDGLYDYEELGSGVDFDYLAYDERGSQVVLNNGFKWYIRKYPNYKALIALATVTAPEEDEKDFNAFELQTGWKYSNQKTFSLDLSHTFLMKFFTDKKIVDADGILEDEEREEYRNSLRLETAYSPNLKGGFQYNLSSEISHNISNQNFYDSRGTTTLTDDVFTPDYFDYISLETHPRISYTLLDGDRPKAIIGVGYNFLARYYLDRKAQMATGIYTSDDQHDYQHIFEGTLEIPFDESTSWVTSYDYTINDSNMDFEQYYEYSYKMHRVLTGISINY